MASSPPIGSRQSAPSGPAPLDLDELDLTPWLEYFVGGLDTQLAEVRERGRQAILVDVAAQEHSLNGRQAEVLRVLATEGQMTIRDLEQRFPGVARRTLQRDLKLLVVEGLLSDDEAPSTDPNRRYRLTLEL